ncbi:MAG TPA: hypothetical protein VFJ95_00750 [Gammaproteobacteria bacterium]|nr:hypothetical protein [Gammaproteobacteria bacterium]
MRILIALVFLFLGGCSALGEMTLNADPPLDPSRIYLGTSHVTATLREIERYGCTNGPLYCQQSGINFDCRCP